MYQLTIIVEEQEITDISDILIFSYVCISMEYKAYFASEWSGVVKGEREAVVVFDQC